MKNKTERMPKADYFRARLQNAIENNLTDKATYYQNRLTEIANTEKPNNKFKVVSDFINTELENMNRRSMVATPETRANLESFAKANQGSMDLVLMQMAIQFGYKMALENTFIEIESIKQFNQPSNSSPNGGLLVVKDITNLN